LITDLAFSTTLMSNPSVAPTHIRACLFWLKLGCISFGGPAGQVAIMHQDYVQALFGPEQLFAAGTFATALVTWFTFLPSFIFILAGGRFIGNSHNRPHLTNPLGAISAAMVGLITNLAILFYISFTVSTWIRHTN